MISITCGCSQDKFSTNVFQCKKLVNINIQFEHLIIVICLIRLEKCLGFMMDKKHRKPLLHYAIIFNHVNYTSCQYANSWKN